MLPRNAFNVTNWSFRQTPSALIFRPTWKTALIRLLFGTGLFALFTLGLVGADHELRSHRERRAFSPEEIKNFHSHLQPQIDRLIANNETQKAQEILHDAEQSKNTILKKREAELAQIDATHRPLHIILLTLTVICILAAIYFPLSTLWLRVRITRHADTLTFHRNTLIPRSRSIAAASTHAPHIQRIRQYAGRVGGITQFTFCWKITLTDPQSSIQLFLFTSPDDETTIPPRLQNFLDTLRQFASQPN